MFLNMNNKKFQPFSPPSVEITPFLDCMPASLTTTASSSSIQWKVFNKMRNFSRYSAPDRNTIGDMSSYVNMIPTCVLRQQLLNIFVLLFHSSIIISILSWLIWFMYKRLSIQRQQSQQREDWIHADS